MVSQATTDDGQHRTIDPTTKRPSRAIDAFISEIETDEGTVTTNVTRKQICEALAYGLPEDDIRQTDFNVRFREQSHHAPNGTLLIEHPRMPDFLHVAVTSNEASSEWDGKRIPGTTYSAYGVSTDVFSLEENVGCMEALRAASERLAVHRDQYGTRGLLTHLKQWLQR